MNKDILLLLRKRIDQIEIEKNAEIEAKEKAYAFEVQNITAAERLIPISLIPYLSMYLLFNSDCFPSMKEAVKKKKIIRWTDIVRKDYLRYTTVDYLTLKKIWSTK